MHYLHVIEDDIAKLVRLRGPPDNRYVLLFDEVEYMLGQDDVSSTSRLDRIIKVRDNSDQHIRVVYMKKEEADLKLRFY